MSAGEATPFPPPTPKLRPLFAPTGRLPFRRANSVTTPLISTSLCLPSVHAELQESSISRLSQTPLQRFLQSADKIIKDEGTQRHQCNPKSLSSSRFNGKNAFKKKKKIYIYIYIIFPDFSCTHGRMCSWSVRQPVTLQSGSVFNNEKRDKIQFGSFKSY